MSKQVQVNLAFNADTSKAKAQINDLVSSLNKIITKDSQIFDDRELREAANAAKDLTKHLENAVNVNTGKLDLNKFTQSLSQSKQSLSELYNSLSKAGPQGQQAFLQLASSIASSESQVLSLSSKVKDLGTTLKNTIKWQLSSSLVHGFMGAMSQAIGYAKDLNSSLNDIRIVTGAGVDEMARFAEQANKSAKALSSTTTEYTKASLIYYQQGLNDAEVKERTDVTIKMANVSKTSAETVSDQMTAVWNNFYDGSKSLEYYADVMTALGAATASSVDEISGGLEKFAAIGDTIGLSYEYAASALATITSNTRQSEEVVGTALKTIFARIQGLNLGETLDDGTTLNKYSAALEKVGISIFDQAGEIKNMDSILDEMGDKWQELSKDQQIALAQTVAGTRQYTQLVALMDNWDVGDSDSFQVNLNTAYNSEGALQEQQDIYAESWEAAADRVKAATEDIYDSLLNDEAIIPILNGLENVLNLVGSLIDGFGGLQGIILLVGATFTKSFANEIPDAVNKIKTNLKIISGQAEKEKQANVVEAGKIIDKNKQDFTGGNLIRAEATVEELSSLQELELIRNRITESEYAYIKSKIAEKKASQEAIAVKKDEIDQLEKEYQINQKKASQSNTKKVAKKTPESKKTQLLEEQDILGARQESLEEGRNKLLAKVHKGDSLSIKQAADLDSYNQELQAIEERNQKLRESIQLEEQRQTLIEKEGLAKKDENGEIIGIDEKKYQESITSKANQLRAEYEKQATDRLNIEDYNRQVSSWTASTSSMKLKDLGAEKQEQEISKLKKSIEQYATKLKEANNVQFNDDKFTALKKELEQVGISAEDAIAAFKKFASETDINEATKELEKVSTEVQQLESDLRILTGDGFKDIQTEAYESAQEIALAKHTLEQFENEAAQIDVDIKVDASSIAQTLTEVASIAMDIGTIITSLKSMFATWGDESASITDKVTTSLSSLGSIALSSIQIFSTISSPGFLDGIKNIGTTLIGAASSAGIFKGTLGKLGGAFTTAGSSATAFLGVLGKFTIAAFTIWAVVKVIDALHTSQAEANESIAEATKTYEEEKEKLDELNSSLKTTSDRIEELQSKGTLSLVEQEELNRLLEQEASLERQVALQERKAQLAKEESANAFEENVDKASQWINTAPVDNQQNLMIYDPSTGTTVGGDQGQYYTPEEYLATINKLYTDENGNIIEGYETQYEGLLNYYKEWVQNYNKELLKWIESNEEAYNTLIQGYQDWYDINKDDKNKQSEILANAKLISDAQKAMHGDQYDEKVLGSMDNIFKTSTDQKDKDVVDNIIKDLEDGIVDADPASIAEGFSDTFKQSLLKQGIVPDDYAQYLIDEYTRAASALKGEVSLEDLMSSKDFNSEDLEILAHLQLTGEETLEEILAKIDAYKSNTIEVGFNLDTWKKDYTSKMDAIDEIDEYGRIDTDSDEWALLSSEYSEYFDIQNDGTAILTTSAEKFKAIVESIELDKLENEIDDAQSTRDTAAKQYAEDKGIKDIDKAENQLDNSAQMWKDAYDKGTLTEKGADNFLNTDAAKAMQSALGIDLNNIESSIEKVGVLTSEWNKLGETLNNKQSAMANAADSFDELRNQLNEGTIDAEEYNAAIDSMVAKEAETNDLDYNSIIDFAEYLNENADALENYDDSLKDNLSLCKKVATAQAKLNKAVETAGENWEDWTDTLENGSVAEINDVISQVNDVLADMLDLTDEAMEGLSDDFAIENWDLIEDVVNGVDGALEKLQVTAAQDVMINLGIDESKITTEMTDAMSTLANMAAGTHLEVDTEIDTTNALEGLVNLLAQVGVTGDQIQAIFDNLGWDPEITYEETDWTTAGEFSAAGYQQYAVMNSDGSYTVKSVPLEGEQNISEGGKLFIPHIKATKKSGGSGSYTPSSTSSSGGGGGSSSTPTYAEKKSSSDKERYHTLVNQLEDLTDEYDALAEASDRAFGQDKLDAIDDEIAKTDELISKQEEYVKAIKKTLPVDKNVMTAYYNDLIDGPSIKFDENGNISNYDQIQNAMFDTYNAMTAYDEDSTEWQVFEEKYEQLEKYIEQYEETYDLLREQEAEYQDLLNQRIDLELEKVEYSVEIQLEVPEAANEVIEYQLGRIEDDVDKTSESIALLTKQAENLYDQIQINKQGINDALKLSMSTAEINELMAGNMDVLNGKTFTEDQIDAIKDYRDNLLELNEEFDDLREEIEDTVLNAFDELSDALDNGVEQFDHYNSMLESYKSIIKTVGKDTLGISDSLINTLSQVTVENAINQVEATHDAYKALQQTQINAEEELEKAKARGDEQSIAFWEDTLDEIQEKAQSAQEEMMSAWEESLTKIAEQFEASVQTAVDAFNEAVYQLGGIEGLSEEFDRQKEMADIYLDDYQKIYELSKLNRDINNSIDDTDSLAGKQKLKKLLGEINELQADGVKMSEYDLEYLQAEYDLRLAEIALEEAQRAKDVVRLSRDNEGNWSYVYTQNTDAVDEAQQKYEDALYAMQDLSSNYIDEISQQLIETSQEMQEALAAIRIEDYASIEEYYEEVERVQEQYQEQLALQEEELNKAVANNKELYDTDWTNYHNAVGYKISDTKEFATKFSDTLLGTLMNSESDTSNFTNILADATSTLMNDLYGAAEQYYTNMAAAMEAAGTTTGTFADDLSTNVDQIKQDSEEAAIAVEDMAEHMQEQMDNIINKVGEWQRTYGEAMNEIINANLAVINSFNEMLSTLSMDDSTVTVKYDIQNHNSDVLDAERFATGGYTGSWGNTGRLGILDEKELILNKDDTENFIEALKISRSMLNTIDLNARQASLGLGTMVPATIKDDVKETLEQIVTITAEFPNATDHNEIEEAFNTLINRASQFANRK